MLRAPRLALALLLAALGPALPGCAASTELKRIRAPREGVALDYALETGQGYEGQLRVGNTWSIAGLEQPLSQTISCDVTMAILRPTPGGTEVRATFNNVDLDWDLPPSATYSSADLIELAAARLRGMQITLVIRPDGRVLAIPGPPPGTPPELQEVIDTLLHGLEAFFVPLPPEPMEMGELWEGTFAHDTDGGLHQELDQQVRLKGMYRHRDEELELARLSLEQQRREQRPGEQGPVTVERESRAQVLFTTSGYPFELDRETREFDPVAGMVFRKVRAKWRRVRGLIPELAIPETNDVQVIRDPCNPDYVGPELCPDQEPPAGAGAEDLPSGPDQAPPGGPDEDPPGGPDQSGSDDAVTEPTDKSTEAAKREDAGAGEDAGASQDPSDSQDPGQ